MPLADLPNEMLAAICEALCPHCQAAPFAEPSSVKDAVELMKQERDGVKALAALCLTSRGLYKAAVPFLYHRPLTSGLSGYESLMWTVMAQPTLADYIQSLVLVDWHDTRRRLSYRQESEAWPLDPNVACLAFPWVNFIWARFDLSKTVYCPEELENLTDDDLERFEKFGYETYDYPNGEVPRYVTALAKYAIMCCTPNIRTLSVQVHDLGVLKPAPGTNFSSVERLAICATDSLWEPSDYPFYWTDLLPNLASISEQFQNLRCLELRDAHLWHDGDVIPMDSPSSLSSLKELRLRDCVINEVFLERMLEGCNSLQYFELSMLTVCEHVYTPVDRDTDLGFPVGGVMQLLVQAPMQHTLKCIHLGLSASFVVFPLNKDISFHAFARLRECHLTAGSFFRERWCDEPVPTVSGVLGRMPSSLEVLCLSDWSNSNFIAELEGSTAEEMVSRFPKLRELVIEGNCYDDEDGVWDATFSKLVALGIRCEQGRICYHANSWEPAVCMPTSCEELKYRRSD